MRIVDKGWPLVLLWLCGCASESRGSSFAIPNGEGGIGFDDLRYSPSLHRVLVPSGRSGVLTLLNPNDGQTQVVSGFSASHSFDGGHDFGLTSVDEGQGYLFATDRTAMKLYVIDANAFAIVASVNLSHGPDYVRWVAPTNELWVTEPGAERIEIFSLSRDRPPMLTVVGSISVANGPESLVIDPARARAYTHRWQATTVAIDVKLRSIVAEWPNGCAASRGIDIDLRTGFVFAACQEGIVSVLDPSANGATLSSISKGAGYDVIAFQPALRHLYLAGSTCACLVTLGVSPKGQLSFLSRRDAPRDTHCVTADDMGNAWVCGPSAGKLYKVHDPSLASR